MPRLFSAKVLIYLCLVLVLDTSFIPFLNLGPWRPVLFYLMVIYACFEWHWVKTLPTAFFVGAMRDLISSQPFGIEAVSLILSAFLLNFYVQKITTSSIFPKALGCFLFVATTLFEVGFLNGIFGAGPLFSWSYTGLCVLSALSTTLLMPLFFFISHLWFRETAVSWYQKSF